LLIRLVRRPAKEGERVENGQREEGRRRPNHFP
jgi:hypothetical protein